MTKEMQQVNMGGAIKNDLWITDVEEAPDPSPLPKLPGFHVLVRPVSVKSVTKGGIIIPDSTKDDMAYLTTVAQVIAMGDLAYRDTSKFPDGTWCNVGDYVCYGKHAGTKMVYKGVKLILLFDDQVIMKVEDPKDLDPTFNLGKGSN
jgi:co-chaperonin GroES (HSP10)|tara:strand:+ start:458 stop:898 length:441 start_codon:yes stop_codon:yes gene_type:complete